LATFWANFSQIHLVALAEDKTMKLPVKSLFLILGVALAAGVVAGQAAGSDPEVVADLIEKHKAR
jgi:hypothetical protein